MKLRELVSRNVSAALREVANAEAVAKHSKDGTVPVLVTDALERVRKDLEKVSNDLAACVNGDQPLP
jgi:hypothetical protein